MAVTAMFVCQKKYVPEFVQTPEGQGQVYLAALAGGSKEAEKYFAATPYGELKLGILNQSAYQQFEEGKTYRLTIEEV